MSLARRVLDAVTLRRVVAVLFIGSFADAIFSILRWLASIGRELQEVPTLRAFLMAAARLALEAGLIYLALRGLRSVLGRRSTRRAIVGEAAIDAHDPTVALEEVDRARSHAPRWPGEGGEDGRGSDY